MKKTTKMLRFIKLYGLQHTLVKVASRLNNKNFKYLIFNNYKKPKEKYISLIGCGHFGFSTVSYFLLRNQGKHFLECYDIEPERSKLLSNFYGYKISNNSDELLANPLCKLVYIASNHSFHSDYAIKALANGKDVYLEKPISVTFKQFENLKNALLKSNCKIYAGYNRPYSKAIRTINSFIDNAKAPISLNCFISGHMLGPDHWYRNPSEGTRICGNVGHWFDLMIHFMNKRGFIPKSFEVAILQANINEPDNDINIAIKTEFYDIVSILITSRTEPFEGINETIDLQCGDIIAKIDDFRSLYIWNKDKKYKKHYYYKDVGHRTAIDQPFLSKKKLRAWKEVEISTQIMLEIADMVNRNITKKIISFS